MVRGVRFVPPDDLDEMRENWELRTELDLLPPPDLGDLRLFHSRGVGFWSCLALHLLPHLHLPCNQNGHTWRRPLADRGVIGADGLPFPPLPPFPRGERPGSEPSSPWENLQFCPRVHFPFWKSQHIPGAADTDRLLLADDPRELAAPFAFLAFSLVPRGWE